MKRGASRRGGEDGRGLERLLRQPPPMDVTPEEFDRIQERVWARIADRLTRWSATGGQFHHTGGRSGAS